MSFGQFAFNCLCGFCIGWTVTDIVSDLARTIKGGR